MSHWVTCIDVALDSNLYAVGRVDGTVIIAELTTGQPVHVQRLHENRVSTVAFEGSTLWTAAFDGQVAAWDLARGEVRRRFDAEHGGVIQLRAGPGFLLTVGDDGNARLWNPEGGPAVQILDETRFGPSYSALVTPDWITIGYQAGYVTVWKPAAPGGPVTSVQWEYEGNLQPAGKGPLYSIAVSPSQDLVAFGREGAVCLHKPGEWPEMDRLPVDLACNDLQFNSTGSMLIGACSDRTLRVWDRETGSPGGSWPLLPWRLGEGMEWGQWEQEMICSGARFVGDQQAISSWFDGTVQLYRLSGVVPTLEYLARQGEDVPAGWER